MNYDTNRFTTDANELPHCSQHAFKFSHDYIMTYLEQHTSPSTGLDERRAAYFAAARLDWLLRESRSELSGQFNRSDLTLLMNCFQGDLFDPAQVRDIAGHLCDDLGIDVDGLGLSAVAPLLKKLNAMTPSQRLALADALEQAWHRGIKQNTSPEDVFIELGIAFMD